MEGGSIWIILVDLCSIYQAGAVGQAPGPDFGRKPTQNLEKLYNIYIYIYDQFYFKVCPGSQGVLGCVRCPRVHSVSPGDPGAERRVEITSSELLPGLEMAPNPVNS